MTLDTINFIPQMPGVAPSYWCTWATQNFGRDDPDSDAALFAGAQGARLARHHLNEAIVFGSGGWIEQFPEVRAALFFMFDDGWDVPYDVHPDTARWRFGSLEVSTERFPSCSGSPAERLAKLNARVQEAGWRGAGLWVAAQAKGEGKNGELMGAGESEIHWRERARWCREAGIEYWKVDWGARAHDLPFRRLLTQIAHEEAPGLLVEHAFPWGPLNDESKTGRFKDTGDFCESARQLLDCSDVVRAYDVLGQFAPVTMLDRVADLLARPRPPGDRSVWVNSEDELYLGAALGCTLGVMRSGFWSPVPGVHYQPRGEERKLFEVTRALRWQRLAPPCAVGEVPVAVSSQVLTDSWAFEPGDTWVSSLLGQTVSQSAPSVVARGLPLPAVTCNEAPPFVVASRHPNGSVSVATIGRIQSDRTFRTPLADVRLDVRAGDGPIGVFGFYGSLFLPGLWPQRIFAQDLAGHEARDISDEVERTSQGIHIKGSTLQRVGQEMQPLSDSSEPGLVLNGV